MYLLCVTSKLKQITPDIKNKMETQNKKNGLRNLIATGIVGLASLVGSANAQTTNAVPIKTSGDLTYFVSNETKSPSQNSYAELNHSTKLPYGASVSGFMDLYRGGNGYFGKTVVEEKLTDRLSLRAHVVHINEPLSQAGFGASYRLLASNGTFAKISYLPVWTDTSMEQIDNKQIAAYFVSADLPFDSKIFSFGEINVAGKDGPQWAYGEIEAAKNIGNRLSVGLNLQLNNDGAGKMTPEVVPRIAVRVKW
jgi:hypothetical protein